MINLDFLENSGFFQIINLESGEVLFDEGDIDNNLYIIKKGELSIEKYTTSDKNDTKLLAKIGDNEIFGEGSLSDSKPKQVKIIANKYTTLLKIDAQYEFEKFLLKNTRVGIDILSSIINITNKRLLESNFLITSSYKINKYISEITQINNKNLFSIIDELKKTINASYILYLEKHPVLDNYLLLKYDTREEGKLKDIILDLGNNSLKESDLKKSGILLSKNNFIQELINNNKNVGYLVIGGEKKMLDEGQKKAITIISISIAGFIKQKQYFEDNRNLEYSKI